MKTSDIAALWEAPLMGPVLALHASLPVYNLFSTCTVLRTWHLCSYWEPVPVANEIPQKAWGGPAGPWSRLTISPLLAIWDHWVTSSNYLVWPSGQYWVLSLGSSPWEILSNMCIILFYLIAEVIFASILRFWIDEHKFVPVASAHSRSLGNAAMSLLSMWLGNWVPSRIVMGFFSCQSHVSVDTWILQNSPLPLLGLLSIASFCFCGSFLPCLSCGPVLFLTAVPCFSPIDGSWDFPL